MCKNKKSKAMVTGLLFIITSIFFIFSITSTVAAATQAEMIEAAKKEGSLYWLDSIIVPESAKVIIEEFKKHYGLPDSFSVNHQRLRTGALCTRVGEEVKAGKVIVDIFGTAVPSFFMDLKKAKALLKYDSPENAYYKHAREVKLTFDPGYWQSAVAYAFAPIAYPKTYPKPIESWYDLLDPGLKGKKISFPVIAAGGGPLTAYYGWRKILSKEYFEKMAAQEPTFDRGSNMDAVQRLLQKESLVAITAAFGTYKTARSTGVELKAYFPKEGVTLSGHGYAILAKAKHPNAAKLFYDFIYGEKGMKLFIDLEGTIAIRDGMKVPEEVKRYSPPLEEVNAIPIDWTTVTSKVVEKYQDEFKEMFRR